MTGVWIICGALVILAIKHGLDQRRRKRRWRAERLRFELELDALYGGRGLSDREASLRLVPHGQGVQAAPANPPVNHKHRALLAEADPVRGGEVSEGCT